MLKLAFGVECDDTRTQIINTEGQHVCYIEIDPHLEIAQSIIEAVNNENIKKELITKILEAQATVIEDIHAESMAISDVDEDIFIDMIVEEVNKNAN